MPLGQRSLNPLRLPIPPQVHKRRAWDSNPDILLECRFSRPMLYQLSQLCKKTACPVLPHKISGSEIHVSDCLLLPSTLAGLHLLSQFSAQVLSYLSTQNQSSTPDRRVTHIPDFPDINNFHESLQTSFFPFPNSSLWNPLFSFYIVLYHIIL